MFTNMIIPNQRAFGIATVSHVTFLDVRTPPTSVINLRLVETCEIS